MTATMTTFHEIMTATGTVWVRVDQHASGRNVAAMDWTDGTTQRDIDAAVATAASRAASIAVARQAADMVRIVVRDASATKG